MGPKDRAAVGRQRGLADDGKRWSCADRCNLSKTQLLREGAGREGRGIALGSVPWRMTGSAQQSADVVLMTKRSVYLHIELREVTNPKKSWAPVGAKRGWRMTGSAEKCPWTRTQWNVLF